MSRLRGDCEQCGCFIGDGAIGPCGDCESIRLRAELAAAENMVTALTTQRGLDAVAAMRAVAEKGEEVRETCARIVEAGPDWAFSAAAIRATPLTATPLTERIAELEARVERLTATLYDVMGSPGFADLALSTRENVRAAAEALKERNHE